MRAQNMITIVLAIGLVITSFFSINKNPKDFAEDLMMSKQDSILAITHKKGSGTVFVVITSKGKKVGITNNHVCEEFSEFILISRDGSRQYPSKLIANYKTHDLCMVTVPQELPPLEIASKLYIDDKIFSAGFAGMPAMSSTAGYFRTIQSFYNEVPLPANKCFGTWKQIDVEVQDEPNTPPRKVLGPDGKPKKKMACMFNGPTQFTTMPVTFGASGSPILNEDGKVVGVVMALQGTLSWCVGVPLRALKDFLSRY